MGAAIYCYDMFKNNVKEIQGVARRCPCPSCCFADEA
jgi:hypothetical protein